MAYAPPRDTADVNPEVDRRRSVLSGRRPTPPTKERDTAEIEADEIAYTDPSGHSRSFSPAEFRLSTTPPDESGARRRALNASTFDHMAVREEVGPSLERGGKRGAGSLHKLRRFIGSASLTSATLLVVFGLLYLQGAVPATIAVALGTVLLVATAAFAHTWYDFREQ